MSRYTNVNVSEGQKQKLPNALQNSEAVSIRLAHEDINGENVIALTQTRINKMVKAYGSGKA